MKNNIKAIRESKNLTQKDCADLLGITIRAWQTYEQGVSEPKQELLFKIADMFDVSLDYLLGREPAPDPFGELNLSEDDEKAVLSKYMSLPENVRAIMLDVLRQLGTIAKDRENDSTESDASVTETAAFVEKRLADDAEAQENAG